MPMLAGKFELCTLVERRSYTAGILWQPDRLFAEGVRGRQGQIKPGPALITQFVCSRGWYRRIFVYVPSDTYRPKISIHS